MEIQKQFKDKFYKVLQEPNLDKFREFLEEQTGEHNYVDFKGQWITGNQLAKEMLAMANSGGGIIIFGISENEDKSTKVEGIAEIRDHAIVSNEIKNYISSELKYDIFDFSFETSEYKAVIGKHFQMLVIEDTPEHIPFLSKRESGSLKTTEIYIRRGTSCEVVNQEELKNIINRRINYLHPLKGEPLQLDEHLKQLEVLYGKINKNNVYYKNGVSDGIVNFFKVLSDAINVGEKVIEPNPLYPDESYEEFISRLIVEKKKKIERVLDLY